MVRKAVKNKEWEKKQKRHFILSLADEILIAGIIAFILFLSGLGFVQTLVTFFLLFSAITALKFKLYPFHPPKTGREAMIGSTCMAITPLSPKGVVKYDGELWRAVCINGSAEAEDKLRIVDVDGLTLVVEKI